MKPERQVGKTSVHKNYATGEWVVMVWDTDGKRWEGADYYTTDREDARVTAERMKEKKIENDG